MLQDISTIELLTELPSSLSHFPLHKLLDYTSFHLSLWSHFRGSL